MRIFSTPAKTLKMAAARKTVSRLENDIEKFRFECNWEKVLELVKGIKTKTPALETLGHLALGEAELELHLLQYPPTHQNIELARKELSNAKHHLQQAAKTSNKPSATEALTLAFVLTTHPNVSSYAQHAVKTEAQFLLAKLYYATGDYDDALKFLEKAHPEEISVQETSPARLKMLAESYAIKGMCLECLNNKSGHKHNKKPDKKEKEMEILACYEKAGDLALLYLQRVDQKNAGANVSGSSSLGGSSHMAGPVLETAVQKAPLLRIQEGKLDEGIDRFRTILKAVEVRTSQTMRATVARELAEVLLRGVCMHHYTPPSAEGSILSSLKDERSGSLKSSGSSFANLRPIASRGTLGKPKMYSTESIFVPKNVEEEALLLLLISELQVNRDVVLSRHKEHSESRKHTFLNATAVYDLLAITLVRRAQYNMLADTLDRTMKFSFEEFHMWFQFGLALASAGRHARALRVLRECSRMEPKNHIVLLEAAKICYDTLELIDDGIEFCQKAVAAEGNPAAVSRGYLMLGMGYGQKAHEVTIHKERQDYQKKALQALNKAYLIDSQDYTILYHTALQLALSRQIPEALQKVRGALKLNADDLNSLHLLSLLLSAQKQFSEALNVIEVAANQYPDKISLLFTKIKLEEVCLGPEEALVTCKQLLNCWKQTYDASLRTDEVVRGTGLIEKVTSDKRSLAQMHISEFSDRDSVQKSSPKSKSSVQNSLAASRVEQALSEVGASSTESTIPRQGSQFVWNIQARIWLTIAELYLLLDKPTEARACVQEACAIFPLSHQVMFMRGCVHEHREAWSEAKNCYDSSLSFNPTHIKSLQNLGRVLFYQENYQLAEKVLRDAVNIDPTAHMSWINLGKVLEAQGEYESASDCLLTGLQLEATSPVQPFSIVSKTF
ncbi:tetratricopeptide repeat protein 7B-like isoform X3 [Amphiura filiformis]|uniref:tetratricopeptide repeat protein 7B-like isoform X3 n=1 Tax=Amphiura filiformis TaxID=82378 RepID=UPI003B2172FC